MKRPKVLMAHAHVSPPIENNEEPINARIIFLCFYSFHPLSRIFQESSRCKPNLPASLMGHTISQTIQRKARRTEYILADFWPFSELGVERGGILVFFLHLVVELYFERDFWGLSRKTWRSPVSF